MASLFQSRPLGLRVAVGRDFMWLRESVLGPGLSQGDSGGLGVGRCRGQGVGEDQQPGP